MRATINPLFCKHIELLYNTRLRPGEHEEGMRICPIVTEVNGSVTPALSGAQGRGRRGGCENDCTESLFRIVQHTALHIAMQLFIK